MVRCRFHMTIPKHLARGLKNVGPVAFAISAIWLEPVGDEFSFHNNYTI